MEAKEIMGSVEKAEKAVRRNKPVVDYLSVKTYLSSLRIV